MKKIFKNLFFYNKRKRVNKLYDIIKKANDELTEIGKGCGHKTWHTGNYGWAPGHFNFGGICDNCDEYLGEAKTLKDWWGEFMSQWQNYAQYIIKKPEFLSQKVALNFSDPFRQRFYLKRELDKELRELVENRTANGEHMSKEMKEYFDKWVKG